MLIGVIGWCLCGLLLGFIASKLVSARSDDPRIGMFAAAGGGLIGGVIYSVLSGSAVAPFNQWSLVCAAIMAVIVLAVWHVYRLKAPYKAQSRRRSY
jgi:uncharacterized membrane protein YeaQ/YmgE (transglycosylase-associated protein family)